MPDAVTGTDTDADYDNDNEAFCPTSDVLADSFQLSYITEDEEENEQVLMLPFCCFLILFFCFRGDAFESSFFFISV